MQDIADFKAGQLVSQGWYSSFQPESVNEDWAIASPALNGLVESAGLSLGALDAYSRLAPDADAYIRMHIIKEATTSSSIEGTRTNMDEAVMEVEQIDPGRRDDWQEVDNYIKAMDFALKELDRLPISGRLLRKTHEILMHGVRGEGKSPGQFRTSQNWIGGATLNDATFVPPVHTSLSGLMGDLEKFLNNELISTPHLIRIAISHYQFETIHPFLDGNGRLGRLLITLYLVSKGILCQPTLYLSDYFERNRLLYYDNLRRVSERGDMEQWLKFFLVGVIETADLACSTLRRIIDLRSELQRERIPKLGRKQSSGVQLMEFLFRQPIVTVADVAKAIDVSKPTANALVADVEQLGILEEQTGFGRNRVYRFSEYMHLFARS